MECAIDVKVIDDDRINVLGKDYYSQDYLVEMMEREYQRGKRDGRQIHIAQVEYINKPEYD